MDGRVEAEYVLPDGDVPPSTYFAKEWEKREATLHHRDGDYYLHIAVVKELDQESDDAENETVLGGGLNVDGHLAVTSTGAFIGKADYLNHKRHKYEKRRGEIQQTGTRSAHLTMKSIGGRFAHWSEDYLHRVSKALVQEALAHDCTHIAFENLEHIRKRISNAPKFQQWAFSRIQESTEYKAAEYGIAVEKIAPQYTSQRCNHGDCSFTNEDNRAGDDFVCLKCDREYHADYNAGKNIVRKLLQNWHRSRSGGAPSHLALKSGTLNVNGVYSPTTVSG